MPKYDLECVQCGQRQLNVYLASGQRPPCPCGGATQTVWTGMSHGIETDESFIGGQVIENLAHEPITVYSRTELKEQMLKHGAEQRIKWAGPGDKYLINWAAGIDPVTLENARILVSRK